MKSYFKYWGKAKKDPAQDGDDYHLLVFHCLDVAAVGWKLLEPTKPLCQRLAKQIGVEPEWLQHWFCFCLALHDLGKLSRAFQNLVPNLSEQLVSAQTNMAYSERHDSLGFLVWQDLLATRWVEHNQYVTKISYLQPWLESVTGHHGTPPINGLRLDDYFNAEDKIAACEYVTSVEELFLLDCDLSILSNKTLNKKVKQHSWQFAGIAVLADWLGSDQNHFHYHSQSMPLKDYWLNHALKSADIVIKKSQIDAKKIEQFHSITQLFPFINEPTPLQQYAIDIELQDQPQLFMLEDVTGAGKTEAALTLVHRLLDLGAADGVYIALPTMATSNGMYQRLAQAYRSMYQGDQKPSLVLAHGASRFSTAFTQSIERFTEHIGIDQQTADHSYQHDESSASAYCSAWVADSRKKSLLADVGVGTLDQALLSILPAKHQSLRLLGLSRKVLVIDEVHAYDSYMQGLLETLLEAQARQGGSVILLSATLPYSMRSGLTSAFAQGLDTEPSKLTDSVDNYPLATHLSTTAQIETKLATRKEVEREVFVKQLDNEQQVVDLIKSQVKLGKSVCWVRNTVKSAKKAFDEICLNDGIDSSKVSLFHSRFAMIDRQRIENNTLKIFGKNSTSEDRSGQVLIATQVVEQSLDLDFDVMITDLAPVDLVLQRAGRLHRHVRDSDGNRLTDGKTDQRSKPILYLLTPQPSFDVTGNWLKGIFPSIEYIYPDLGQLWLSAKLLLSSPSFAMPQDARKLIEGVYGIQAQQTVPDSLIDKSFEARAVKRQERGMATLNALKLKKGYCQSNNQNGWDDDIPTRLADNTYSVALARIQDEQLVPYAQSDEESIAKLWALSCVTLREQDWQQAEKRIPYSWQEKIAELKQHQPCLKWLHVLPLVGEIGALYSAKKGWVM